MLVLVASTGQEVEVECDCDTTLGALQTELEEKTEVPTNDQLLVFAGARLAGKETALSKYGLPMDANGTVDIVEQTQTQSRFVVLYRKSELRPVKGDDGAIGSAEPECAGVAAERESAGDGENETFPEYAAPRNTYEPLSDDPQSSVTNENLLPWFHRAFSAQVRYASRRLRCAETQLAKCGLLVRETRVSEIALRVAVGTLGEPFSCFMKKQRNFTKEQEKRIEKHESALAGFDGDMETLRLTRLNDPAPTAGTTPSGNQSGEPSTRNSELGTQQPVRTTLMDCVPYGRIVDWCGACRLSHGLFKTKLEDLATEITELTRTAEDAMSNADVSTVTSLDLETQAAQQTFEQQTHVLPTINKNLLALKSLIEYSNATNASTSNTSTSTSTPSADQTPTPEKETYSVTLGHVQKLNTQQLLHVSTLLPGLDNTCDTIATLHERVVVAKLLYGQTVRMRLRNVSAAQGSVKKVRDKLFLLVDVAKKQDAEFLELSITKKVPVAYTAMVEEAGRRALFDDSAKKRAVEIAKGFQKEKDDETKRRTAFFATHERFLPKDVALGLGLRNPLVSYEISRVVPGDGSVENETNDDTASDET